jgi:hypothetical protein
VAQPLAEEGEKVEDWTLFPLLVPDPASKLKGEVSGRDVSNSSAGGCEETASMLGSGPSLGWLAGERRGSSP